MKELLTKFADGIEPPAPITGPGTTGNTDLSSLIIQIINWIMGIIGFVCVITIIISGIQYMTSGGDPGKVKKAKVGFRFSIIGLVVAILAAAIVNFVIAKVIE